MLNNSPALPNTYIQHLQAPVGQAPRPARDPLVAPATEN
jgi:hypothetical protein